MMINPIKFRKNLSYVFFSGEGGDINYPAVLIQRDYDRTYPAIASEYLSPQADQIEIGRYELIMSMC
jgi:hypothetical protein